MMVMNWLASREGVRGMLVDNVRKDVFRLKGREVYGLMFEVDGVLAGVEIPYYIVYRMVGFDEKSYKIVKNIRFYE